jgi:L,D-transpeptidase YbiS
MYSIEIDISEQLLQLFLNEKLVHEYLISSGKNGVGEEAGSGKTPTGWHYIRAKIGADCPINTVFIGRRPTGEIYTPELGQANPQRDWILTRIMWLSGLEKGKNRLGHVDSMRRYIYLHGTPDEEAMGKAASKGCIRMRNKDIVELFATVPVSTKLLIRK